MTKLHIMKGLPASGKTTKARELMAKSGYSLFRTNKDDLRESMFGGRWSYAKEIKIKMVQEDVVRRLLSEGVSCIVDDTNLKERDKIKWFKIADKYGATIILHDMTKTTTVDGCVERDRERDKPVGDHVIWSMALRNNLWNSWNGVILCDIDGTLADIGERRKHVQGEIKDWESFFAEINLDKFRQDIWDDVKEVVKNSGYDLFLVSGRNEKYREETIKWFKKHCPEVLDTAKCIFMRGQNDFRPDTDVKRDILKMFHKDDVKLVYDDRPSVIRMWQENKIATIDCGDGKEF